MLVSRVSTDERPSANRKGAGNPGGRACPSGDSSVINTSFHLFKTRHKQSRALCSRSGPRTCARAQGSRSAAHWGIKGNGAATEESITVTTLATNNAALVSIHTSVHGTNWQGLKTFSILHVCVRADFGCVTASDQALKPNTDN